MILVGPPGSLRPLAKFRRFPFLAITVFELTPVLVAAAAAQSMPPKAADAADDRADDTDLVSLGAYNVRADRVEDFGFRVSEPNVVNVTLRAIFRAEPPFITAVLPNTAAAKAGLQPGDRILKSESRSAAMTLYNSTKWAKFMRAKNAEAASGKGTVTWTLEIQPRGTKSRATSAPGDGAAVERAPRTVTLMLPTSPPRWGGAVWRAPEGRLPSTVAEPGPLAERCRTVLDHGIWILIDPKFLDGAGVGAGVPKSVAPTGYAWHFGDVKSGGWHRMTVTQRSGRTEVILEAASNLTGSRVYRTSPTGALERAWRFTRREKGEIPLADARAGFDHEIDLWATKVQKLSPRWPLEVIPGYDPNAIFAILAATTGTPVVAKGPSFAEEFLKLPPATDAQRRLFTHAYAKLGVEADQWAYTETSRGLEDDRLIVTRVDPSMPEAERCVLLSVDGKTPTPADLQRWRDDGGDTPKALGDIPSLAGLVDLKEVRVFEDETAAVVFELPIRSGHAEFPVEKFQALFRVNKTHRAFEDIAVKLRDSFRVAGVVKVVDAGMEVRFEVLDPALAPQPVRLKAGGGVRVLLVKFSRSFEVTRTGFKRVMPREETGTPAE